MNLLIDLTKKLKPHAKKRFLLGVSGGADSTALLSIFLHFKKHFDFDFGVCHFHHGSSDEPSQLEFRFKAHGFVAKKCLDNKIPFFSNFEEQGRTQFLSQFGESLSSESEFRDARHGFLEKIRLEQNFDFIVLAHHSEDLLETRLIRLIRGTGPEGLNAMEFEQGKLLRPLLEYSPKGLKEFLSARGESHLEDPSNMGVHPLRNWIRHQWLPDLDLKWPNAKQNIQRSLDLLVTSLDQSDFASWDDQESEINISELLSMPREQRSQRVASYMKGQGLKNYGLSHVNEVLKRLDREEKSHTFRLLGRSWKVDAGRMSLQDPN